MRAGVLVVWGVVAGSWREGAEREGGGKKSQCRREESWSPL